MPDLSGKFQDRTSAVAKRIPSLTKRLLLQPRTHIVSHWLNDFMGGVITSDFHIGRPLAQLRSVIGRARRRIELIARTAQMKNRGVGLPVKFAGLPIARHSSTNANHPAQADSDA